MRMPHEVEAELSSLATALEELTKRVTAIADRLAGTDQDAVALDLYQVERSLAEGGRRLARASGARRQP